MYARLTTYRFEAGEQESNGDPQAFIRLLGEQQGCRAAWELAEEGSETTAVYFSMWDTKEQAQAAGDNARAGMMELFASREITLTAPPVGQDSAGGRVGRGVLARLTGAPASAAYEPGAIGNQERSRVGAGSRRGGRPRSASRAAGTHKRLPLRLTLA